MIANLEKPSGSRQPATLQFSGHESFVCRYGWLPKLYQELQADPDLFEDTDGAIIALGIGKNMVKSIRFWGQAYGLFKQSKDGLQPTRFAVDLLDPAVGSDPYLESHSSLWKLHWRISSMQTVAVWRVLINDLKDTEIGKDQLVERLRALSSVTRSTITQGTAAAHADIFIKTYAGDDRSTDNADDSLASPFQELGLLSIRQRSGRTTLTINRGPKTGLDESAMAFALSDFWAKNAEGSSAISMRALSLGSQSPGTVFKLDEISLHRQVAALCKSNPELSLREDGVGNLELVCIVDSVKILERAAWPSKPR